MASPINTQSEVVINRVKFDFLRPVVLEELKRKYERTYVHSWGLNRAIYIFFLLVPSSYDR